MADMIAAAKARKIKAAQASLPQSNRNVAFIRSQFAEAARLSFARKQQARTTVALNPRPSTVPKKEHTNVTPVPAKQINPNQLTEKQRVNEFKKSKLLTNDEKLEAHMAQRRQNLAKDMMKDVRREGRSVPTNKTSTGRHIPARYAQLYNRNRNNKNLVAQTQKSKPIPPSINEAELENMRINDDVSIDNSSDDSSESSEESTNISQNNLPKPPADIEDIKLDDDESAEPTSESDNESNDEPTSESDDESNVESSEPEKNSSESSESGESDDESSELGESDDGSSESDDESGEEETSNQGAESDEDSDSADFSPSELMATSEEDDEDIESS